MSKFYLAESPIWHSSHKCWFWTDILAKKIYTKPFSVKKRDKGITVPEMVSNIVELDGNNLLCSAESKVYLLDLTTNKCKTLVSLVLTEKFRCNDGSVGPDGKYWFGTMEKQPSGLNGELYSLDVNGSLESQNAPIGIPNSFIWLDDSSILISDSLLQKTYKVSLTSDGKLDWDNRTVWLDLSDADCTPDGGALDEDGNVWLAIWGGAAIHKYSPNGELLEKIQLKALQPTSCAFGGPNMDSLLITTATEGLTDEQLHEYPESGDILIRHLPIKGKLVPKFRMNV